MHLNVSLCDPVCIKYNTVVERIHKCVCVFFYFGTCPARYGQIWYQSAENIYIYIHMLHKHARPFVKVFDWNERNNNIISPFLSSSSSSSSYIHRYSTHHVHIGLVRENREETKKKIRFYLHFSLIWIPEMNFSIGKLYTLYRNMNVWNAICAKQ